MLWYDKSKDAIQRALEHCEDKYGIRPTVCHVNPSLTPLQGPLSGIKLVPDKTIMLDYYWLVIDG